jgi:hypothetical protein
VVRCCYSKLLAEIGKNFWNTEEMERPPLKTATKQRLVKTNRMRTSDVSYSSL